MVKIAVPKYGDLLFILIQATKTGGKYSPEFQDEYRRLFNELGERLQAAEEKIAELQNHYSR